MRASVKTPRFRSTWKSRAKVVLVFALILAPIASWADDTDVQLDANEDPIAVARRLRSIKEVEFVDLMPRPQPLPAIPDFDQPGNETGSFQGYLRNFDATAGTTGIGAVSAWWPPPPSPIRTPSCWARNGTTRRCTSWATRPTAS